MYINIVNNNNISNRENQKTINIKLTYPNRKIVKFNMAHAYSLDTVMQTLKYLYLKVFNGIAKCLKL